MDNKYCKIIYLLFAILSTSNRSFLWIGLRGEDAQDEKNALHLGECMISYFMFFSERGGTRRGVRVVEGA